jgi:hypothetical protein
VHIYIYIAKASLPLTASSFEVSKGKIYSSKAHAQVYNSPRIRLCFSFDFVPSNIVSIFIVLPTQVIAPISGMDNNTTSSLPSGDTLLAPTEYWPFDDLVNLDGPAHNGDQRSITADTSQPHPPTSSLPSVSLSESSQPFTGCPCDPLFRESHAPETLANFIPDSGSAGSVSNSMPGSSTIEPGKLTNSPSWRLEQSLEPDVFTTPEPLYQRPFQEIPYFVPASEAPKIHGPLSWPPSLAESGQPPTMVSGRYKTGSEKNLSAVIHQSGTTASDADSLRLNVPGKGIRNSPHLSFYSPSDSNRSKYQWRGDNEVISANSAPMLLCIAFDLVASSSNPVGTVSPFIASTTRYSGRIPLYI